MPRNPENIFVTMLALLAFASPAQTDLINHTYWAYIPNPPLLQVVEWTDIGLVVSTNDSVYMPPPWSLEGPSHPEEEGRLINISLGYEILPLCMGPAKLCINVSRQTWAFVLPPKKDFRTLLGLFTALSLSENHVNTTKTLGKGKKLECKVFTYKDFKYTPVYWDRCQAKLGKLMFVANYTIVDWGPYGMWLSNFSDDINSTMCDYVTQVAWKVTKTTMEHFRDKGLLGWLDGGMAVPRPQIILNKQIGPEQWDIWKLAASTEKLGTWTGYFTGTSCSHSNYSFYYNHS